MRRTLALLVLFTVIHGVVTLSCMTYAIAASSASFDGPTVPPGFAAGSAKAAVLVLTLPGRLVWTSWASQNLPNAVEWLLFIVNSAVWGAVVLVAGTRAIRFARRRTAADR